MSRPDVTVVIPTYGRWEFVETALRTVSLQEGPSIEIVIVADGPRAHEWDDRSLPGDGSVRILAREQGNGVSAARNRGMDAAQGRWVAFLDDDDVWAPGKLAAQLAAMEASGAAFAYSSGVVVNPSMEVRWLETAPAPGALRAHLVENNPIPACSSNLVVHADLRQQIRFDHTLMHFADWDFAVQLIMAEQGAAVSDVQVGYLWHDANMHTSQLAGIEREFAHFRAKHLREGLRLGGPSQSRWIAGSHREAGHRLRAAAAYLRGAVRYRSLPDVVRAGGVLLGERAMAAGSRRPQRMTGPRPEWLALYR
jgi:glycosyltransferase involved in cell wall biosynthesis